MSKKVLLITGASSEIGIETMRGLDPEDFTIIAQYCSNSSSLEQFKKKFPEIDVHLVQSDLSKDVEVASLVKNIEENFGRLDAFIHLAAPKNAMIRFKDLEWDKFTEQFDIQLKSAHLILKAFLPEMAKRKIGKVVFVLSSVTQGVPPMAMAHYVTSKYALLGYMKALTSEYRTKNININAISPSMVDTKFLSNIPGVAKEMAANAHPLKRLAQTTDVAPLIHFLLSSDANYMNGVNIPITGGEVF